MTVAHWLRERALSLGVCVERARDSLAARPARLLRNLEIDLVLDVGANEGQYASALRRYGYKGKIVSFEPIDPAFSRLMRRANRDHGWEAIQLALGSDTRTTRMHVANNGGASSSLLAMTPLHRTAAPLAEYTHETEVMVTRLDALASDLLAGSKRPALKLDVQGYELNVLAGCAATLDLMVAIQVELSLAPLYIGGPLHEDVLRYLGQRGFKLFHMAPGFWDRSTGELLQYDAVFVRKESPLVRTRQEIV
jgi:FkbM family methyltransferase